MSIEILFLRCVYADEILGSFGTCSTLRSVYEICGRWKKGDTSVGIEAGCNNRLSQIQILMPLDMIFGVTDGYVDDGNGSYTKRRWT